MVQTQSLGGYNKETGTYGGYVSPSKYKEDSKKKRTVVAGMPEIPQEIAEELATKTKSEGRQEININKTGTTITAQKSPNITKQVVNQATTTPDKTENLKNFYSDIQKTRAINSFTPKKDFYYRGEKYTAGTTYYTIPISKKAEDTTSSYAKTIKKLGLTELSRTINEEDLKIKQQRSNVEKGTKEFIQSTETYRLQANQFGTPFERTTRNVGVGLLQAGAYTYEDLAVNSEKNLLIYATGSATGKAFGFVVTKFPVIGNVAQKGLTVAGVGGVGLAGYQIVTSDNKIKTTTLIVKDAALFGVGFNIGYTQGVVSGTKSYLKSAVKTKSLAEINSGELSKDVRVLTKAKEVRSIDVLEVQGKTYSEQYLKVNYGKTRYVDVRDIPRADAYEYKVQGVEKLSKLNFYGSSKGGLINPKADYVVTQNYYRQGVVDKKSFENLLELGNIAKISGGNEKGLTYVFQGRASVQSVQFNEFGLTTTTGKVSPKLLTRSKPIEVEPVGVREVGFPTKKPSTQAFDDVYFIIRQSNRGVSKPFIKSRGKVYKFSDVVKVGPSGNLKPSGGGASQTVLILQEPKVETITYSVQTLKSKSVMKEKIRVEVKSKFEQKVYSVEKTDVGFKSKTGVKSGVFPIVGGVSRTSSISSSRFRFDTSQVPSTGIVSGVKSGVDVISLADVTQDTSSVLRNDTLNSFSDPNRFKTKNFVENKFKVRDAGLPRFDLGFKGSALFRVFVRRRGKFREEGVTSNLSDALGIGKRLTLGTSARSFKIISEGKTLTPTGLTNMFRRSKKERGVFIEKNTFAIDTSGELKEITFKGLATQKMRIGGFKL